MKNSNISKWTKILCSGLLVTCAIGLNAAQAAGQRAFHPNSASHGADHAKATHEWPHYPKIDYSKYSAKEQKQIKHGEYLAMMGDCIACHTAKPDGIPFAGGLSFKTPFGVFYTPNITPDKATGIGNWTFEEFKTAMRDGIGPKGNDYPVFPFVYFNKITTPDLHDIWAFLRAMPPIKQRDRKNKIMFPFNIRFFQAGWKVMFFQFHKGRLPYDAKHSKAWNRGRYLVDGLGHCAMCHSPMNLLGASKRSLYLAGNFVDGYYAPNITSATTGKMPIKEIVDVFAKGDMLGGGHVEGPMAEVNHDSLDYLKKSDLVAIATYLKTVPAIRHKEAKITGGSALAVGKGIYEAHCTACHATGAAGAPVKGNYADWKPRIALGMKQLFHNAIHGIGGMPAKGTCMSCSDKDIKDAVRYLVHSAEANKGGGGAAPAVIRTAPPPVDTSLKLGRKIYGQSCSMCHADGKYGAPMLGDKDAWNNILKTSGGGMPTLFERAIKGYKQHPKKGACLKCTNSEIEAAVKYMITESIPDKNFKLW